MSSDGSGMDDLNPEDIPIPLPSSLGWSWCTKHDVTSLAVKEARLRNAQANEAIHRIRLALGFKSALFRTQVRHARTQKTKTRAWSAIHGADTTVQEHACVYSMARDAYQKLRNALQDPVELPKLLPKDLNVQTLILGSEQVGQRNTQLSWIWGFGKTVDNEGTWMSNCEWPYRLRYAHMLICIQLKRFTGSVQRHSLSDGWRSSRASIMKLNGFLPGFMPRQRLGKCSWMLLDRDHFKDTWHMHQAKCTHGRNCLKALWKHCLQYYRPH